MIVYVDGNKMIYMISIAVHCSHVAPICYLQSSLVTFVQYMYTLTFLSAYPLQQSIPVDAYKSSII